MNIGAMSDSLEVSISMADMDQQTKCELAVMLLRDLGIIQFIRENKEFGEKFTEFLKPHQQ